MNDKDMNEMVWDHLNSKIYNRMHPEDGRKFYTEVSEETFINEKIRALRWVSKQLTYDKYLAEYNRRRRLVNIDVKKLHITGISDLGNLNTTLDESLIGVEELIDEIEQELGLCDLLMIPDSKTGVLETRNVAKQHLEAEKDVDNELDVLLEEMRDLMKQRPKQKSD